MKGFAALLRLQLLSRFADLKPRNLRQHMAKKKAKTIGMIFAYVVLFAWVIGFVGFLEYSLLTALIAQGMPDLLLSLAVMASMLSTLVLAFFFIMSSLYFGRDSAFLAALPVHPRTVLAAKLTQVWLSETGISALFLLPAGLLYGIRLGESIAFYLRLVLVLMGMAVLPVVIVAFLSTLLVRLSALWKRRELVATVGGILLLIAYMYFCMQMGSMMPDDPTTFLSEFFTNNQARILALTRFFPPAAWAAQGLCGDWGQLALFLAVCALAAGLTVWVLGMFYRKLSLLQTETPTAKRGAKKEHSFAIGSPFKACCQREIRQILRIPTYATNTIPTALMPVLMVVMMYVSMKNALAEEGGTLMDMLSEVNGGVVLAVMAALMAFMAGLNPALCSAVTREGRGHDFLTALPLSPRTAIMAKMTVGVGISALGCLPAAIILMYLFPAFALEAALAFAACMLFCYASGAIGLANDVANPKLDWLTETEAIKQKSGTLIGMLISWGILIALGVGSYFLLNAGVGLMGYAAALLAVLALCAWLAHRLLMRTADTKYCQG